MILYTNLNNIREKKKIIIPESKLALLSEAKVEINNNIESSKDEIINELHTTVNSYVVNAKNEVISNDNANKETILTTIKGWLKI